MRYILGTAMTGKTCVYVCICSSNKILGLSACKPNLFIVSVGLVDLEQELVHDRPVDHDAPVLLHDRGT